jgi:hypothetical protein
MKREDEREKGVSRVVYVGWGISRYVKRRMETDRKDAGRGIIRQEEAGRGIQTARRLEEG